MLVRIVLVSLCASGIIGRAAQDDASCAAALTKSCPADSQVACPICVTKAWPSLRMGDCSASALGKSLSDRCQPAQGHGQVGLFKSTYAASDPVNTTLAAFLKYLPVLDSGDSCKGEVCRCGATGRVDLVGNMFGLHTVLAAGPNGSRANAPFTGPLTVSDIEHIFDEKLGNLSKYSAWMDYNTALWAPAGTLDVYTSMIEGDGLPILRLSWPCPEAGGICYSAIWHIPHSQVVVEMMSNETTSSASMWRHTDERRHVFATGAAPTSAYLTALHDSRAVADVDEVVRFYKNIMNLSPLKIIRFRDGTRLVSFALATDDAFGHNGTIQYVERPTPEGSLDSEHHSTAWFQRYLRSNANKYMVSPTSCWPIWGDNHLAIFMGSDSNYTTDDALVERCEAHGWPYHPFLGMENLHNATIFGHTVVYFLDPSGWQIEYHGGYINPPNNTDVDVGDFDEYCTTSCVPDKLENIVV